MTPDLSPEDAARAAAAEAKDREHLRLLAIFHFVGAGFSLLGCGFLTLHYSIFAFVLGNPQWWDSAEKPPPPEMVDLFNTVFVWFYAFGAVVLIAYCVLNLLAGIYLRRHRHRIFCMVVAGMNCVQMPLGTILGVFTLVVLSRDSVRALFDASPRRL